MQGNIELQVVSRMVYLGVVFLVVLVTPHTAWGAPIACTGATSGNAGTCSTIANCAGTTETPANQGGQSETGSSVCPDQWLCCIAPGTVEPKDPKMPPIDPLPPVDPGDGGGVANQGASCAVPSGGTGQCEFTDQCSANNQVPTAGCLGGTVCCVLNNSPGDGGTGGGAACAGGNGTCTTIADCMGHTPISDPTACSSGLVCCPDGGPGSGGGAVGGTGTSTTSVNCTGDYQKIAGVCFPKGTGLSEKSVLEIVATFVGWLLSIFGFIALVGFIISGIQYLLSAGDEGMAETAKRNMKYSIIGIIVALSGWIIIKAIDTLLNANPWF